MYCLQIYSLELLLARRILQKYEVNKDIDGTLFCVEDTTTAPAPPRLPRRVAGTSTGARIGAKPFKNL